jgi:N-acetyl-anhydromuramyl-L-alanine amidase AmpD
MALQVFAMNPLHKGDHGSEVRRFQVKLVAAGYCIHVDARFGDSTDTALRAFQCLNSFTGQDKD